MILEFFLIFSTQTIEDNVASSERIPDNDSEDLDELAVDDTDLLLTDLDAREASGSGTTQSAEVTTNGNDDASTSRQMSHSSADTEPHSPIQAHQTENEKETDSTAEDENESQAQNEDDPQQPWSTGDIEDSEIDPQPEQADTEDAAIDKELNEESEEDATDDDEDAISLDPDDDLNMFSDVDDGDASKRYLNS